MALIRLRKYRIFLAVTVCCLLVVYLLSRGTPAYSSEVWPGFGKKPTDPNAGNPPPPGAELPTFPLHNESPPPAKSDKNQFKTPESPHMPVPHTDPNPNDLNPTFGPEPLDDHDDHDDVNGPKTPKKEHSNAKPANRPHWTPKEDTYPVPEASAIPLPTGTSKPIPKIQYQFSSESNAEKSERQQKLDAVKASMQRTWTGYKTYAWKKDELKPQSGSWKNKYNGWGATLVDSLDTLWIMGMKEEFEEAVDAVKTIDFTRSTGENIPLFETTIRYLGGLLGAYDVSGAAYPVLLEKATELGNVLIGAFDTPNRMPILYFSWKGSRKSNPTEASSSAVLAELGSLSLEFTRLSQLTKDPKYYDAVARIGNGLAAFQSHTALPGLWPLSLDISQCVRSDTDKPDDEHPIPEKDTTSWGKDSDTSGNTDKKPPPASDHFRQKDKSSWGGEPDVITKRQSDLSASFSGGDADYYSDPDAHAHAHAAGLAKIDNDDGDDGDDNSDDNGDDSDNGDDGVDYDEDETEPPRSHCLANLTSAYSSQFGIGGEGDSTYEYLPKEYLLLGGLNGQYESMYTNAAEAIKDRLLYRAMSDDENRELLFTGKYSVLKSTSNSPKAINGRLDPSVGHLSCFQGAMFALGAKIFNRPDDLDIGSKMTDGCVWAYEKSASGIMPDDITPIPCSDLDHCAWNQTAWYLALDPLAAKRPKAPATSQHGARGEITDEVSPNKRQMDEKTKLKETHQNGPAKANTRPDTEPKTDPKKPKPKVPTDHLSNPDGDQKPTHEEHVQKMISSGGFWPGITRITSNKYILRPEAIESVWYLYRITGNNYWRQKGWDMFQAVEKATKTQYGNSAIADVSTNVHILDEAESFWTAETLKYFYLLFSEPDVICLDDYVLNTEAHPFLRPDSKRK